MPTVEEHREYKTERSRRKVGFAEKGKLTYAEFQIHGIVAQNFGQFHTFDAHLEQKGSSKLDHSPSVVGLFLGNSRDGDVTESMNEGVRKFPLRYGYATYRPNTLTSRQWFRFCKLCGSPRSCQRHSIAFLTTGRRLVDRACSTTW